MGEDPTATKHRPDRRRVTVAEASEILGITAEAVRTRIKRGKPDQTLTLRYRVKPKRLTKHARTRDWLKCCASRWRTSKES